MAQTVRVSGRGIVLGVALIAGLVLSAGPLLGAMIAVVQVLRVYAEAAQRGEVLAANVVSLPYGPIALGFAAFVPGVLLLTISVLGYSWRVKRRRMAGRD